MFIHKSSDSPGFYQPKDKKSISTEEFAQLVVYRLAAEVKKILIDDPEIAFRKTSIIDNAGREFVEASAFQYALWALDQTMWELILSCINKEEHLVIAQEQLQNLKSHGLAYIQNELSNIDTYFNIQPLMYAYRDYRFALVINIDPKSQIESYWKILIKEQKNLPVNFLQEFYELEIMGKTLGRIDLFSKSSTFGTDFGLIRGDSIYGEIFTTSMDGHKDESPCKNSELQARATMDGYNWSKFWSQKVNNYKNLTLVPQLETSTDSNWNVECGPQKCLIL